MSFNKKHKQIDQLLVFLLVAQLIEMEKVVQFNDEYYIMQQVKNELMENIVRATEPEYRMIRIGEEDKWLDKTKEEFKELCNWYQKDTQPLRMISIGEE